MRERAPDFFLKFDCMSSNGCSTYKDRERKDNIIQRQVRGSLTLYTEDSEVRRKREIGVDYRNCHNCCESNS